MKALIIEDEIVAARGLATLLQQCTPKMEVAASLDSISSSVSWLKKNMQFIDLIFLDIHLKDGLSFAIFDLVKIETPIIFCTAYEQYAINAFKSNSVDYLLKPITKRDLQASLDKYKMLSSEKFLSKRLGHIEKAVLELQDSKPSAKSRLVVKAGRKIYFINFKDIVYIFTQSKVVYVVNHLHQKYIIDQTLDELIIMLPEEEFYRVSRQSIVCLKYIELVEKDHGKLYVEIKGEKNYKADVSRYRARGFLNWLNGR